jgi:hypothetical protein
MYYFTYHKYNFIISFHMTERLNTVQVSHPEKRISGRLVARSLGEAALVLCGYYGCKQAANHCAPTARRLFERLNITEREGHPQTVNVFKSLAESFGVNVEEEHLSYWQSMLTIARALDTIVDDTQPDSLDDEVSALLSGKPIAGTTKTEAEEFQAVLAKASDERRAIIMAGLEINDIAKRRRSVSDAREMLRIHREEGELFARIMTIDNPEQDPAIDRFNDWFIRFGVAGYQLDSFMDLADDFKNGVAAVPPTPANYFTVGKEAMRDTYGSLSQLPRRTVAGLAIAGLQKSARKIVTARTSQQN